MRNRREFLFSSMAVPLAGALQSLPAAPQAGAAGPRTGFPVSDYTPFGYLDNPFHSWNMHRSGVLRSLPGIGFGFYYPAGPGGYFAYQQNAVYEGYLRIGFLIGNKRFWTPKDFAPDQLTAPYHSKNIFEYAFTAGSVRLVITFVQAGENALAARIGLEPASAGVEPVRVVAVHEYRLKGATWWGRDGVAGNYYPERDAIIAQSWAAGTVFAMNADRRSRARFVGPLDEKFEAWLVSASNVDQAVAYYPAPLGGALMYDFAGGTGSGAPITVVLARGANRSLALEEAQSAIRNAGAEIESKRREDTTFWTSAPKLEGDWPKHWKHGWVYDFETLRMMVRRPIGVYKHPWDAMQIQAPRNVLAETSIDMWALSYADPETAKAVFLGQFLDAPADNVPCMREDGQMNMIAADGSECGTSISWCFPYFCADSIWSRTRDVKWLSELYPRMARLLRWTLANRTDADGFVVGKCSWETGMDASQRFLIKQPTGGELTEFVRLVELQAAAAHAAGVLARFASAVGDSSAREEWRRIQRTYTDKTQALWKGDWFYDVDARSKESVTHLGKQIPQAAPAFCGVASPDQMQTMLAGLREFYGRAKEGTRGFGMSSTVLPYLESLWSVGDLVTLSQAAEVIAEWIYTSMDRRSVAAPSQAPAETPRRRPPGWPGVSCEAWTPNGAGGGEGYGWGAVFPGFLVRGLIGFRETPDPDRVWLSPNLPDPFLSSGKNYGIRGLRYLGGTLNLRIRPLDAKRVTLEGEWSGSLRTVSVEDAGGRSVAVAQSGRLWKFEGTNHSRYAIRLSGV